MKVMLAVHDFPPEFIGGVERVTDLLARHLAEAGHDVRVFCGSQRTQEVAGVTEERRGAVTVHRYRRGPGYPDVVDPHDPAADDAWDRVLCETRPDVVYVHHWYRLTTALVAIAARRRIPAAVMLHDYWTTCPLFFRMPQGGGFCREIEREAACSPCVQRHFPGDADERHAGFAARYATIDQELRLAAAIVVSSRSFLGVLARLSRHAELLESKVEVVPLGLPELGRRTRRPAGDQRIVIAHWGNLSRVKGVRDLVVAAAGSAIAPRLRLLLLGRAVEPDLLAELESLRGAVLIEHHGAYEPAHLPALLEEADFAVFPSLAEETHSLVVDEALALAIPVIVSDRGAMAERLGPHGAIVPAGDVGALRDAIERFADPARRPAGSADPAAAPTTMRDHARGVEAILRRIVERPPGFDAFIADHGRDRLAFRLRRLDEIHRYVVGVEGARRDVEAAILGDAESLKRVLERSPELGRRLEDMLGGPAT